MSIKLKRFGFPGYATESEVYETIELLKTTCKKISFKSIDQVELFDEFNKKLAEMSVESLSSLIIELANVNTGLIVEVNNKDSIDSLKLLTKLKNISELIAKIKPTENNIIQLNRIIANNADNLSSLLVNCNDNKVSNDTYEINLSPLAASNKLRILSVVINGIISGVDTLPDCISYLALKTNSKQQIDISKLPKEAWYISIYDSRNVTCSNENVVYPNVTALGILNSGIGNDIVKCIPNMFPAIEVMSLGDSAKVTDVSALAALKNLYMLYVDGTSIEDSKQFEGFDNLLYLDITDTLIESVRPLYKLSHLSVIAANENRFFSDEARDFDYVKEHNLPIMLQKTKEGKKADGFMSPDVSFGSKQMRAVYDYITSKLNNSGNPDKFRINQWDGFESSYYFNLITEFFDDGSISKLCGGVINNEKLNSNLLGPVPLKEYHHLKKASFNSRNVRTIFTLPGDTKLEYLSAPISKGTISLLKSRKDLFTEIETIVLKGDRYGYLSNDISLADLNDIVGDSIKNINLENLEIEGNVFYSRESIQHISINTPRSAVIEFDLDAMPNLVSIELNNVIPKFKATKKHNNLRYIKVNNAWILNIDEMFISNVPEAPVIAPIMVDFGSNNITTMKNSFIDLSKAVTINVKNNLLTDNDIQPMITDTLRVLNAEYNLLSICKSSYINNSDDYNS